MQMKLNQAQRRLLMQLGSMVEDGLENHYYFLPLWFKIEKNSEVVDAYSFGHLPPELLQAISDQREAQHPRKPQCLSISEDGQKIIINLK